MRRRFLILGCLGLALGCGDGATPGNLPNAANSPIGPLPNGEIQLVQGHVDLEIVELTADIKAQLEKLQRLRSLQLIRTNLRNADLGFLADLAELEKFTLRECRFREVDFETFPQLDKLATLTLSGPAITDACADRLAELRLPALRSLSLEDTSLTDEGVRRLCEVYNLKFLNLYCSRKITAKSVPEIGRMNRLERLGLGGTGIAPNFMPAAGVIKELKRLLPKCEVDFGD